MESVVPVGSTRVAEMVKLLENTFRSVNIGLVNEMALLCDRMGINVWEVIDAAATKPFGYMPFYPGRPGRHCIPVRRFIFPGKRRWTARSFIELAGRTMARSRFVAVDPGGSKRTSGKRSKDQRFICWEWLISAM
jgi:UDP-N-acetyl-D-glucosamine dehydrogenase